MSAAYIFDVEGTLIDCVPDNLKCWSETLAGFGVPVPAADLQRLSGMDGDEMLEILAPSLDEHERKKILTAQGERYRAIYLPRVKAFPGVRTVFTAIKSEGGRIALATDCQSDELKRYRSLIGADDLIDAIACGDEVSRGEARSGSGRTGSRSSWRHASELRDHDRRHSVRCAGRAARRRQRLGHPHRRPRKVVADRCGLFARSAVGRRFGAVFPARKTAGLEAQGVSTLNKSPCGRLPRSCGER
jgi:phosphoglycolate phosphatase-like HAD superfamily hydrolase